MKSKKQAPAPPRIISNESLSTSLIHPSSPSISMNESISNHSPPQRSITETNLTQNAHPSNSSSSVGFNSISMNVSKLNNTPNSAQSSDLTSSHSLLSRITSKIII